MRANCLSRVDASRYQRAPSNRPQARRTGRSRLSAVRVLALRRSPAQTRHRRRTAQTRDGLRARGRRSPFVRCAWFRQASARRQRRHRQSSCWRAACVLHFRAAPVFQIKPQRFAARCRRTHHRSRTARPKTRAGRASSSSPKLFTQTSAANSEAIASDDRRAALPTLQRAGFGAQACARHCQASRHVSALHTRVCRVRHKAAHRPTLCFRRWPDRRGSPRGSRVIAARRANPLNPKPRPSAPIAAANAIRGGKPVHRAPREHDSIHSINKVFRRQAQSVSRVPGPPPSMVAAHTARVSGTTTVTPVSASASSAVPMDKPATSHKVLARAGTRHGLASAFVKLRPRRKRLHV